MFRAAKETAALAAVAPKVKAKSKSKARLLVAGQHATAGSPRPYRVNRVPIIAFRLILSFFLTGEGIRIIPDNFFQIIGQIEARGTVAREMRSHSYGFARNLEVPVARVSTNIILVASEIRQVVHGTFHGISSAFRHFPEASSERVAMLILLVPRHK